MKMGRIILTYQMTMTMYDDMGYQMSWALFFQCVGYQKKLVSFYVCRLSKELGSLCECVAY